MNDINWFAAGVVATNMVWAFVFIVDTRRTMRRMRKTRR
jgi:hypothetical protein